MRLVGKGSAWSAALLAASITVAGLALGPAGGALAAPGPNPSSTPSPPSSAGGLRLNQLQVVGSHNSYHQEATPSEELVRSAFDANGEKALEYGHAPLATQFAKQKVRQIELDVWADPDGGLYANPLIRQLTGAGPYDPVMKKPGTKVLHIQEIDYHSSCLTLRACLKAVKRWSDRSRRHLPIAVLVEFKDSPLPISGLPLTLPAPVPWTTPLMDTVDADIRRVFRPRDLITPDDVRAGAPTLEGAVLTRGWPTVRSVLGKTMFLMDNDGTYRASYLAGHPSLQGRVLFTNSTPGQPDAAFIKDNDPTGAADRARIQDEVRRGYVVRTRADVDTVQARSGDTTMRDAAFASGAQWVSSDYPAKSLSKRFGTGYVVRIPGRKAARCTPIAPVNAPVPCTPAAVPAR